MVRNLIPMSRRYRLFLTVAGASVAIGLAVALVPFATGRAAGCAYPAGNVVRLPGNYCWAATNNPDWITGVSVAVVVYVLLVGLILSARALSAK